MQGAIDVSRYTVRLWTLADSLFKHPRARILGGEGVVPVEKEGRDLIDRCLRALVSPGGSVIRCQRHDREDPSEHVNEAPPAAGGG